MTTAYPCKEINSSLKLVSGILVKRIRGSSAIFFEHPYDGLPGSALTPEAKVFLYVKTVEYPYVQEDDAPEYYQYDVVLWEDRLIEIQSGRLQKLTP